MKKNLFVFLVIAIISILAFSTVYARSRFTDAVGHWAENPIERWTSENIIKGYGDGTFKPDGLITRAEYVTLLSRIFEPELLADLGIYKDVSSVAWYYDDLAKVVKLGAIQGNSSTTMSPDANITREEAVVILNRILELQYSEKALSKEFTDIRTLSSWAEDDVLAFIENGFINGYPDGTLQPKKAITRAEVVKILDMAIAMLIDNAGDYDLTGVKGVIVVKANNVKLTNTDGIIKVIALNKKVKDTLNVEGIDKKDIPVINPENGEREVKPSGAVPTVAKVARITVTTDEQNNIYVVTRNAVTVATGKKITIVVDGEEVVKNFTVADSDEFLAELRKVADALDVERVFRTLNNTQKYLKYSNKDAEVYTWGVATLVKMGLKDQVAAVMTSDNKVMKTYEVLEQNQALDGVVEAAFSVLRDSISYEDGITILNAL